MYSRAQTKTEDEFKYVFLCPDTPATTYHIEFRYGSDLTELLKLNTGKYANWVGSGILKSALTEKNEQMIQNCIALFCTENLAEMKNADTAAQQRRFSRCLGCRYVRICQQSAV